MNEVVFVLEKVAFVVALLVFLLIPTASLLLLFDKEARRNPYIFWISVCCLVNAILVTVVYFLRAKGKV